MTPDPRLPRNNPVCVHDWEMSVTRCIWVCAACGYEVAEIELWQPQEGHVPIPPMGGMGVQ